jgi:hypothetical protein
MWIFGAKKWTADAQNHRIAAHINGNLGHSNAQLHTKQKGVRECTPNKMSGDQTARAYFEILSLKLLDSIVLA